MEFLKFDDFLIEQTKFVSLETINESSLSKNPDANTKFGIGICTYKIESGGRQNYMSTEKVLKDCLESIKSQSWNNWKIYLVGDAYPQEEWPEIVKMATSIVGKDKIWTDNLKTPGERDKYEGEILHLTGGIAASNAGISQMKKDGIEIFSRIDHDDAWNKDHLRTHAQAYTQYPNCVYCLTQARKKRVKGDIGSYLYFPEKGKYSTEENNYTLGLGGQCHSAMTWKMSALNYIKYRNWDQQKSTDPRRKECFPGDWDNTERIKKIVENENNDHSMIFVPKLTTKYRNSEGKF